MHYDVQSEGVPKMLIGGSYTDQQWYKTLTKSATAMLQLDEKALVAVGMSLCGCRGTHGQHQYVHTRSKIKDNFLHPTPDSLNTYIATPIGAPPPPSTRSKVGKSPTREGTILLSSEESTGSSHGLIHRSTRRYTHAQPVQVSGGDAASKPSTAEPKAVAVRSEQREPVKETQPEA
ncbi:hypothetical protein Hanom_Chr07g00629881 [Helianthus anomalus]